MLIGRADDLEHITAFADRAAASGGALLLSGASPASARAAFMADSQADQAKLGTCHTGHTERNLALIRQLEAETRPLLDSLPSLWSRRNRMNP